jgi:hypothetical protein
MSPCLVLLLDSESQATPLPDPLGSGERSYAALLLDSERSSYASPRPSRVGGEELCRALARLGEIELRRPFQDGGEA